jgi:hypothetical protein
MGFWANSFYGVLRVVRKSRESPFSCFIAFLCQKILDLTPRPPVCIYDDSKTTMSSFICDMKQGYIVQHFLGRKTKREKNDPFWKTVDCGFI